MGVDVTMGSAIHGTEGVVKSVRDTLGNTAHTVEGALHLEESMDRVEEAVGGVGKRFSTLLTGAAAAHKFREPVDSQRQQHSAIAFPTHPLASPPKQEEELEPSTPVVFDQSYVPYSPRSSESRRTSELSELAAAGNSQLNDAPAGFLAKSAVFSKRTYQQQQQQQDVTSPSASSGVATAATGAGGEGRAFLSTLNAAHDRREGAETDGMTVPSLGIGERSESAADQDKY